MSNVALYIAEILNQPVRIWMVLLATAVARLLMLLARIFRQKGHEKQVVQGMAKRQISTREDRVKKAIYTPKPLRRKNREMN